MSFSEDDLKFFSALGLTQNQVKVYLALLKIGTESKALSIHRFSGIARQDVYRVLIELQELGLVEKVIARPIRFHAIPPVKATTILLEKKTSDFLELSKSAKFFAEKLAVKYASTMCSHENDQFILIYDKRAIMHKCQEMIAKSGCSIEVVGPGIEFSKWVEQCLHFLNEATERGIEVRWIALEPMDKHTGKSIDFRSSNQLKIECKHCFSDFKVKLGIFDGKEAILAVFGDGDFAEVPALWSNSPVIVALAKNFFNHYWMRGTSINPQDNSAVNS